ncbi:hypothetical protein CRG98_032641 [Punica granatum]|uniref:A-kinase anchor protein 17A n=1 Tax=Punica granatum TaxID=22663 RepID=A0A2I0ISH1_PUNGR|nr:hypothetical protein CRG98_032641 [Punica granatum]
MGSADRFDSVSPIEPLDIENGLTLLPRVRLNLAVHPASPAQTKPVDDWQLKRALLDYLKNSLSVSLAVPEEDVDVRRLKDLKKRKRDEPLASGSLVIRDLGFLKETKRSSFDEDEATKEGAVRILEKKYTEWRKYLVGKMDGLELNFGGVKFKLSASLPASDDFEGMKKEWEEHFAFSNRGGYSRGGRRETDTIVLRGVPSRWFAEPRVSSKPSMLVTHTIFSTFGSIRNISVAEDNDFGQDKDEDAGLVSGLHCKIVVQFEKFKDFHNVLRVLCGRSMQKQGSRLRADYEVSWDKDDFFRSSRSQNQDKPLEQHDRGMTCSVCVSIDFLEDVDTVNLSLEFILTHVAL